MSGGRFKLNTDTTSMICMKNTKKLHFELFRESFAYDFYSFLFYMVPFSICKLYMNRNTAMPSMYEKLFIFQMFTVLHVLLREVYQIHQHQRLHRNRSIFNLNNIIFFTNNIEYFHILEKVLANCQKYVENLQDYFLIVIWQDPRSGYKINSNKIPDLAILEIKSYKGKKN